MKTQTLISLATLFLIAVTATGIVIGIGMPVIRTATESSDLKDSQSDLVFIDSHIRSAAREGTGAVRIFRFSSPKTFDSYGGEDSVQISTESQSNFIDYMSRSVSGNIVYVSGNDVRCVEEDGDGDGAADLISENDRIKAVFRKISGTIDTTNIVSLIRQKTNGVNVYVGNSSVVINDDASTSRGTGYTEISHAGNLLPLCQIHASVTGAVSYDIYYKLYAGADFIVAEVRNIR